MSKVKHVSELLNQMKHQDISSITALLHGNIGLATSRALKKSCMKKQIIDIIKDLEHAAPQEDEVMSWTNCTDAPLSKGDFYYRVISNYGMKTGIFFNPKSNFDKFFGNSNEIRSVPLENMEWIPAVYIDHILPST